MKVKCETNGRRNRDRLSSYIALTVLVQIFSVWIWLEVKSDNIIYKVMSLIMFHAEHNGLSQYISELNFLTVLSVKK